MGKAKNLKKRVSSYFQGGRDLDSKTIALVDNVKSLDFIQVGSEIEAFLLEANLIKKYRPFYNIQFSDDKYYPWVEINFGKEPYVGITRKQGNNDSVYIGPYPSVQSLKTVLKLLRRVFPFQSVRHHAKRKCLFNHLGLCPCVTAFPENMTVYKKNLKKIEKFFKGDIERLIRDLIREQKMYIKDEKFENAAEIQKQIDKIKLITQESYDPFSYETKSDFYFQRIMKEVEDLKNILNDNGFDIKKLERIECYDISNIQGKNAVGSMVVFKNGDSDKSSYRRFKIYSKSTPDDFHMMKEVLSRRFKHDEWATPDLIVIDGGKGQVSAAMKVISSLSLNIPLIGLAKKEETIVIPKSENEESFIEVKVNKFLPSINILRRIRDEAHRFAITYHRLLRKKNFLPV